MVGVFLVAVIILMFWLIGRMSESERLERKNKFTGYHDKEVLHSESPQSKERALQSLARRYKADQRTAHRRRIAFFPERCESCGARAITRAYKSEVGSLYFCGHHGRRYFTALDAQGFAVERKEELLAYADPYRMI